MKIRRYLAKNTQEAILKVKMDLGNDALILNTRKVRQKGLLKVFAKPMVEVLAAIDEYSNTNKPDNTPKIAKSNPNQAKEVAERINFDEKEEKIVKLENKINSIEDLLNKMYNQQNLNNKVSESAAETEDKKVGLTKVEQILYNSLIKNEIEADIAKKIVDDAVSKTGGSSSFNDCAIALYNVMNGILGKPETICLKNDKKPTVVIFVGPTGVGKTTTLAKIAANYLLNQKKSVGLITADTYRIAAVEQLKTYAEILGIPISVVYSSNDIRDAVMQYSDKDIVLIDTAGRNHKNKTQLEELKALVTASGADEVYLVLSATTSMRNCREILNNYVFLNEYKLIFTKIDEAPVQGIIFNVRSITGKKMSYITTGQNVPDDIEVANTDKIIKNLIGVSVK